MHPLAISQMDGVLAMPSTQALVHHGRAACCPIHHPPTSIWPASPTSAVQLMPLPRATPVYARCSAVAGRHLASSSASAAATKAYSMKGELRRGSCVLWGGRWLGLGGKRCLKRALPAPGTSTGVWGMVVVHQRWHSLSRRRGERGTYRRTVQVTKLEGAELMVVH